MLSANRISPAAGVLVKGGITDHPYLPEVNGVNDRRPVSSQRRGPLRLTAIFTCAGVDFGRRRPVYPHTSRERLQCALDDLWPIPAASMKVPSTTHVPGLGSPGSHD